MTNKLKSKICIAGLCIYVIAIMVIISGCNSKKQTITATTVKKEQSKEAQTSTQRTDSTKTTDNTTTTSKTLTEAKNASVDSTEIEADSIVTTEQPNGVKKTTVYVKPGTKVKNVSNKTSDQKIDNDLTTVYDLKTESLRKLDSASHLKEQMSNDSAKTDTNTEIKGASTVAAYTVPIVAGSVIVIVIIVWLLLRNKK